MGNKTWVWLIVAVLAVAAGFGGGYYWSKESVSAPPGGQTPPAPEPAPDPAPTPVPAPTPAPPTPTPNPPSEARDVIEFYGFSTSGTLNLSERGIENGAFQIRSLEWTSESRTFTIHLDMRAFEAVGQMRVMSESGELLVPETMLLAEAGAPAWSPVQVKLPLKPEYQDKVLILEFYVHSPRDGAKEHILKLKIKPQ